MSSERPLSIPERATILLEEYSKLIGDIFPGVVSTDEFMLAFNGFFTQYQESKKLKLAPVSLREGKITCTSAAALLGLWHELLGNHASLYLIQLMDPRSSGSKSSAHSLVGLWPISQSAEYYHYTTKGGLTPVKPNILSMHDTVRGTQSFLENRLRVMQVRTANLRSPSNPSR